MGVNDQVDRHAMDGGEVLARLAELPGGRDLIELAAARSERVELVGGAVRDILLGSDPRELDVVVHGDVGPLAGELAARLGAKVTRHEQFLTALVEVGRGDGSPQDGDVPPRAADVAAAKGEVPAAAKGEVPATLVKESSCDARIDLAQARAETYPQPGALPQVRPGTPEQDLQRRDFTVNAIAVGLAGPHAGHLRAVPHALEDLSAGLLRVLHDQSFLDDPTRLLRMVRYGTRLGFRSEPHTAKLAQEAIAAGAIATVSGPRLGAEVRLVLGEEDPVAPLAELDRMGVLQAWQPGVCFDEHLVRTALEILPSDGDPRLLIVASMVLELMTMMDREDTEGAIWDFLYDLELPSRQAQRAFSAGIAADCAARGLQGSETTDELLDLLEGASVEGLALAAAMGDLAWGPHSYTRRSIEDWLTEHRHIRLNITGDDLIAAGLPEGPEIGRRLEKVFAMRMYGLIEEDRDAELCAALSDDE